MDQLIRCSWCGIKDQQYIDYHDQEWGVPIYADQLLFAKLILDGAQAGLSWSTILHKRDNYWAAFDNFEVEKIVRYDDKKIAQLMNNTGIVRNKLKINSVVKNARGFIEISEKEGSFSDFLWQFVDGKPIQNRWQTIEQVPAISAESEAMSKALKKYGFSFVGPTIVYAFMQAVGMVNDHIVPCFRHLECRQLSEK